MKRYNEMKVILVVLVISLGFSGCIGVKAFPMAARSGDTISIALGGSPSHEAVPGDQITLDDLTITIKQNSTTYPVKKRYLFRLYPDLTSRAANFTQVFSDRTNGQWSLVLDLVDPVTGDPLPLAGDQQAEIVVTTNKFMEYVFFPIEGSLSSIPITILPGLGESNNFNFNTMTPLIAADTSMSSLQPLPQLAIGFSGGGSVAAATMDIDYDETALTNELDFKIKQNIRFPDIILNHNVYSDNGNKKMRIMLMANRGSVPATDMKCFVVWNPLNINSELVTSASFTVTSVQLYNESGAPVPGISVVKTLLYQ